MPPARVSVVRTADTVRLRLSVSVSSMIATPPGTVAFVDGFNHLHAVAALTGAALDGAVDVVVGHVGVFGVLNRHAQPEVGVGVSTALLRGDNDLARQLGEQLAATMIGYRLGVFDLLPLGMSSHVETPVQALLRIGQTGQPQTLGQGTAQARRGGWDWSQILAQFKLREL